LVRDETSFFSISEFNPVEAPKLNEKVLKDKRKKLKETFLRVFRLYVSIWEILVEQFVSPLKSWFIFSVPCYTTLCQ